MKQQHLRRICSALFLGAVIAVIWLLHLFIQVDETITYINWDSSVRIAPDGTEEPFSSDHYGNDLDPSGTYRFAGQLPRELPAGSLIFEAAGLDLTLSLDGRVIWQSRSGDTGDDGTFMSQASIPLPEGTAGELTVSCTVLDGSAAMFPPLLRFLPDTLEPAEAAAVANREAFPAGAAALALVLIFGIFLLGLLLKKPDWSLIPLLLATAGITFFRLVQSQGYYFLPEEIFHLFSRPQIGLCILLALAWYLAMNRRRQFWKRLGIAALWSAAGFLLCYLLSLAAGSSFARTVNALLSGMLHGQYDSTVYWVTLWLSLTCALISAYSVADSFALQQSREQGLLLENKRIAENYHALEAWISDASARSHEINHQLTALDCLYQRGDYEQLGTVLSKLQAEQKSRSIVTFTRNRTVNTILQNAAAQAKRQQIRFHVQASLPEDLNIPETDLCSLLMNMLDNALEAAAKVASPEERSVSLRIKVSAPYLAIRCENSYNGEVKKDKKGRLLTTKENPAVHGYGCRQMEKMAKKYQSVLLFHTEDPHIFTVETALRIPEKG